MAKNGARKNLEDLWAQIIPDKKLLRKYESLLEKKVEELKSSAKLEELIQPLRQKLERSCVKPLEARNLQEFSQRVLSVLRVQAKKQKKNIEKRLGKKFPTTRKATRKRTARAKKASA